MNTDNLDIMNIGLQFQELVSRRANDLLYLKGVSNYEIVLKGLIFDAHHDGQIILTVTFEEDCYHANIYNINLTAEQLNMSDDEWNSTIKVKIEEKLQEELEIEEELRHNQLKADIAEYTRLKEKLGY